MPFVIKIVCRADWASTIYDGEWILDWRPDMAPGEIITTRDVRKAKKFASFQTAFEYWRQQHGIRPWDHKPNRPLTFWTVTYEPVEADA